MVVQVKSIASSKAVERNIEQDAANQARFTALTSDIRKLVEENVTSAIKIGSRQQQIAHDLMQLRAVSFALSSRSATSRW